MNAITTANQFETIPAFTTIAGDTLGSHADREITCELIKTLNTCSDYDCAKYWQELAENSDANECIESLRELQAEIAQTITEYCPLPDYCTLSLRDSEWIVLPYIEDDLMRLDNNVDSLYIDNHTTYYEYLLVNDHGNVSLMQWNEAKREYTETWAMV